MPQFFLHPFDIRGSCTFHVIISMIFITLDQMPLIQYPTIAILGGDVVIEVEVGHIFHVRDVLYPVKLSRHLTRGVWSSSGQSDLWDK